MRSLDAHAASKLAQLEASATRRRLRTVARLPGGSVELGGKRLVSLSCNDTLGLAHDPRTVAAAAEATARYGVGAGASRLVTGNAPPVVALEAALARFKGTEAACVFGSGYLANLGVVAALAGPGDLVVLDALAHACLHAGAKLSGAAVALFPHNDADGLARLLAERRPAYRNCLVATETVFSMDGDRAPLVRLGEIAAAHEAWLLADDAHGLGVQGGGHGGVAAAGAGDLVPLQVGTLSKAIGSTGGYLCASQAVVALMHSRARTLVYSTGLAPGQAAAALVALGIVATEPALVARPLALATRFCAAVGLPAPESHIVPILLGSPEAALAAQGALEARGFLVAAIRPPTVPEGTSRLRLSFPATLADDDLGRLIDAVRPILAAPVPAPIPVGASA